MLGLVVLVLFSGCTVVDGDAWDTQVIEPLQEGLPVVAEEANAKIKITIGEIKVTVREVAEDVEDTIDDIEQGVEHKFGDAMGIGSTLEQVTDKVFEGSK